MSDLLGLNEERPTAGASGADSAIPDGPDPVLVARAKRGANWFYWIAALSLINSTAFVIGANFHFLAGLAITAVIDALTMGMLQLGAPQAYLLIAIVFDLVVVVGFALAGYFANKLFGWIFVVGMVLYLLDGILALLFGDILMAAFHAFALYQLMRGYLAVRELKNFYRMEVPLAAPPPPPAFG